MDLPATIAALRVARHRADMGIRQKLLRVAIVFGTVVLMGVGLPGTAAATATPSLSCYVRVTNGIPTVRAHTDGVKEGRLIFERQAFNRYWWRGRVELDSQETRGLVDRQLPKTAAQVKYRVRLRAADGQIVGSADCSVSSTSAHDGQCLVKRTDDAYEVSFEGAGYDDVVFRRTVKENGPSHWRGVSRQKPHQLTDTSRELSFVEYQALGRDNGVIQDVFDCRPTASEEATCAPIDIDGLVEPSWSRDRDRQDVEFDGVRARVLSRADNIDGYNRVVVEQPSLGAFVCEDNVRWLDVAGGKLYYFATDHPSRLSTLTTGSSPTIEKVAHVYNWPAFTDEAIYYLSYDGSLHRIDSVTGATTVSDNGSLLPYFTANMAPAQNGNVYYLLVDRDDDSRYVMKWDAAAATNAVFTELGDEFGDVAYIAVSRDGTQLELQDENGFPAAHIDL